MHLRIQSDRCSIVLAAAALLLPLSLGLRVLPAQTVRVVPAQASIRGDLSWGSPFSNGDGRIQQLYDGAEVAQSAAFIHELTFRAGDDTPALRGKTLYADVSLGYSDKTVATMSRVFAANVKGSWTPVLQGRMSLPPQAASGGQVGPWNVSIKTSAPFVYRRNVGNLLLQIVFTGAQNQRSGYGLDAVLHGLGGTSGTFGTRASLRAVGSANRLYPGGELEIYVLDVLRSVPGLALFGLSDSRFGALRLPLALDGLGAPGQSLYVSPDFIVPFTPRWTGRSFIGSAILQIPRDSRVEGLRAFAQMILLDTKVNAAGIVVTGGVRYDIGRTLSTSKVAAVYSNVPTSAAGEFVFGHASGSGLVTRFSGVFR